jgi:signal peptide peptidase SppA
MITPDALQFMLELMDAHMSGTISQEEIRARMAERRGTREEERFSRAGRIGILPLQGPMFPKANMMTELSGATSLAQWQQDFRALIADDTIDAVLLDVDSPGGMSDQVDETASEIFAARQIKPVWSIANTAANSAAYFLASQADKMFATPSGQLGSIGTFTVHTDDSKQQEMKGLRNTVIKAGRFKAISEEPLTADSRDHLQNYVDSVNELFITAVARGRGVSTDEAASKFGEGGIVSPRHALDTGMIDGIGSFDAVLSELGGSIEGSSAPSRPVASASSFSGRITTRSSYDADKEHSEPGTGLGGEPEPREPPEKGDKAIEQGWRRDTPPIAKEEAVERDRLEAMASKLGLTFNAEMSDDDLVDLVDTGIDEAVAPLIEAENAAKSQRNFEKDYPDQAAKFAELQASRQEDGAKTFAQKFERFGETDKGASALLLDKIEDAHLKVSQRTFMVDDLNELLTLATGSEAAVDYSEDGSSRSTEPVAVRAGASTRDVRQQYATEVRKVMEEDNLDRKAAMNQVNEKNPELAAAYFGK